jgi:mono/diheme cytochrome c family protein
MDPCPVKESAMRRLIYALVPLSLPLMGCVQTSPYEAEIAEVTAEENLGLTGLPVAEEVELGRQIASSQCADCHGIDKEDPHRTDAPALRYILADYDGDALAEDFRDGLKVGHPDMPQFQFGPKSTDLLLSYLMSIQEPDPSIHVTDEG